MIILLIPILLLSGLNESTARKKRTKYNPKATRAQAIEIIKKYASINEKFVIQVKRNSNYNNDEFWKAVNFLLQESDFGFEII